MFETAFSSHDDDVIADAVCMWVADVGCMQPGSYVNYLSKRVERDSPFSSRLRQVNIHAIEYIWHRELKVSMLKTVQLLNCLDIDVDDVEKSVLGGLLTDVIHSPMGLESLSSHYWGIVEKLGLANGLYKDSASCDALTKLLEEAKDWDKLVLWMVIAWQSVLLSLSVEETEKATLKLLLQQPSALQRFEDLCKTDSLPAMRKTRLQQVCEKAREEQPPSESPPP